MDPRRKNSSVGNRVENRPGDGGSAFPGEEASISQARGRGSRSDAPQRSLPAAQGGALPCADRSVPPTSVPCHSCSLEVPVPPFLKPQTQRLLLGPAHRTGQVEGPCRCQSGEQTYRQSQPGRNSGSVHGARPSPPNGRLRLHGTALGPRDLARAAPSAPSPGHPLCAVHPSGRTPGGRSLGATSK